VIAYFGQVSDPCGTCDVCQKNALPLDSIPRKILALLEKPMSLKELSVEIKLTEKETEELLRELLKNEIIIWMEGKFYLN
jgi:ATP-dependent DNA helicase RecQ